MMSKKKLSRGSKKITLKNGHICVLGTTGYGKSYFTKKALLPLYKRWVFYDYKNDESNADIRQRFKVVTSYKECVTFFKKGGLRCVYVPKINDDPDNDYAEFNDLCNFVYVNQNFALFVDEASALCNATQIPAGYRRLMIQGRSRGIITINISQRPVKLHNDILSQCDYFIIFNCKLEGDRKKIEGFTADGTGDRVKDLPKYEFLFVTPEKEITHSKL